MVIYNDIKSPHKGYFIILLLKQSLHFYSQIPPILKIINLSRRIVILKHLINLFPEHAVIPLGLPILVDRDQDTYLRTAIHKLDT